MPVTYQQIAGVKSDPIEVTALTSTHQDIAHTGPGVPVTVIGTQIGTAAVTASLVYDRANSTASLIRVETDSATPSNWVLIPIYGRWV